MPKQNRPVVRDGRLQVKKKRTDRSYLRPQPGAPAPEPDEVEPADAEAEPVAEAAPAESVPAAEEAPVAEPEPVAAATVRAAPARPVSERRYRPVPAAPAPSPAADSQPRRRREIDTQALAVADTRYAMHELRRIAILASMVIITLIVLAIVLR